MEPTSLFVEDELFVSGNDGYHTYRIPSLYATLNGTVLAFCEGRRDNPSDKSPTDLLIKRSRRMGRHTATSSERKRGKLFNRRVVLQVDMPLVRLCNTMTTA